jgi:hypothetical protein
VVLSDAAVPADLLVNMNFNGGYEKVITGGLDGTAFLGPPKNAISHQLLTPDVVNRSSIIPPNTEVVIRLTLHENTMFRFSNASMKFNNYFKSAAPTDAAELLLFKAESKPDRVRVELKEICLLAEKVTFANEEIQKQLEKKEISYFYDRPYTTISHIPSGQQFFTTSHIIPKTASCLYVFFPFAFQLFGDTIGKRTSDCCRFTLPATLSNLTMKIDETSVYFAQGLAISGTNSRSSSDAKMYHEYITQSNLMDESFEDIFKHPGSNGFAHVFILNLTPFDRTSSSKLTIEMTFMGAGGTAGQMLAVIAPCEKVIRLTKDEGWTKED